MELTTNKTYISHLQKMIQIPTVSTDNDSQTDWKPFINFRTCLKELYPLIHKKMTLEIIGHSSLLFHWKTPNPKHLPLLLMAHQDVVPAGDMSKWTFPPFSATIADGCIWGRGTTDCKSVLLSELEAVESLIEEGFQPDFDIYIAYGHNEEVHADSNTKGAALIASHLQKQGVQLGCLFDEGGKIKYGPDAGSDIDIAQIAMGEKSATDYIIYKDGPGGHAMRPGKGTLLGSIARAIVAIEEHPLPRRLTPLVEEQLKAQSVLYTGHKKNVYSNPQSYWNDLQIMAETDKELDAVLRTTFAVTMANASSQSNVLPSHAEAIINCRILQGDTVQSVLSYLRSIVPPDVKVDVKSGEDPHPVCSIDTKEYRLLEKVLHTLYDGKILVMPMLLAGGTDSRNYSNVCKNIFRFSGRLWNKQWGESHQIDEKIPCNVLGTGIDFFKAMLKAYQNIE